MLMAEPVGGAGDLCASVGKALPLPGPQVLVYKIEGTVSSLPTRPACKRVMTVIVTLESCNQEAE